MRRKDREVQRIEDKIEIIEKCKFCRLGLSENNYPYIVPLNYGYSYENGELTLYFHSAKEGKKISVINNNNKACFEVDCDTKLIEGEKACNHSYGFKSVIGFGEIKILETDEEKNAGLNYIMRHQTGQNTEYFFDANELESVLVFKMTVESFTGKQLIPRG